MLAAQHYHQHTQDPAGGGDPADVADHRKAVEGVFGPIAGFIFPRHERRRISSRLRRFELEARAASALNHPNSLTVHDVGRDGDIAWFATEWVNGDTLRELMGGSRLPLSRVVELAAQIAEGLACAHGAGIVHRDLKAENVMVSSDGGVKIVDFGVAKIADESDLGSGDTARPRTATGVSVRTAGQMSPEQASGGTVDPPRSGSGPGRPLRW